MARKQDDTEEKKENIFNEIVKTHYKGILKYCMVRFSLSRDAAEDCLQETFILFYQSFEQFQSFDTIGGWLLKTASNLSKQYIAKEVRRQKKVISYDAISMECAAGSDSYIDADESDSLSDSDDVNLHRLFSMLNTEEITLWSLYFKRHYSVREVSEILKTTEIIAKGRIQRLKRKIIMLADQLFEESPFQNQAEENNNSSNDSSSKTTEKR